MVEKKVKRDEVRFVVGHTMKTYPGLFFYSGFGSGYLFTEESEFDCNTTEAREECKRIGIRFRMVDKFSGYSPVYLGD